MRLRAGNIALLLVIAVLFFAELAWGSVAIPMDEVLTSLFSTTKKTSGIIVREVRLPRALTAMLVGGTLALAGLFMQTLFKNALAGPYVLGISSGASLGVALVMFVGQSVLVGELFRQIGMVSGALLGALVMLIIILSVARKTRNSVSLLLIGLMAGIFVNGIIAILQFLAESNTLQSYVFWSMGSLSIAAGTGMWLMTGSLIMMVLSGVFLSRSLNAILMGDDFARSTGVDLGKIRTALILVTSIAVAITVAYCGPVAFIGIAAPQLAKRWFGSSNHMSIVLPVCLTGIAMMVLCDWISQLPFTEYTLPVNAVASLIGAPVVIWTILSSKRTFEF